MSTWDGNEAKQWMSGLVVDDANELVARSSRPLSPAERKNLDPALVKKSKALQYMATGQTYPPERAAGWVQYGMWLVRPRVVREFRGHVTQLDSIKPYWMEVVKAVDRVYANQTLTEFWRHGELVANTAHENPYNVDVPERYQKVNRWFALDTNLDPPRPWNLKTKLPVFSLALVQGKDGSRRWLLYAHSPIENRKGVEVTIPGCQKVKIDVPRAGAFYLVTETDGKINRLTISD
jgi:hypothetical protein